MQLLPPFTDAFALYIVTLEIAYFWASVFLISFCVDITTM